LKQEVLATQAGGELRSHRELPSCSYLAIADPAGRHRWLGSDEGDEPLSLPTHWRRPPCLPRYKRGHREEVRWREGQGGGHEADWSQRRWRPCAAMPTAVGIEGREREEREQSFLLSRE
jgi:hypothetical protein